jgi:hypothetical protein
MTHHEDAVIHPETNEVVDEISRTAQLRIEKNLSEAEHRRAIADIISTLEDKAWGNGFLIGLIIGLIAASLIIFAGLKWLDL